MRSSIKKKINLSFYLLVSIFLVNGIIIFWTVDHNRKLSTLISENIDPSIEELNNFKLMIILSREFSINWVYLRSNEDYKKELSIIQSKDYPLIRKKLKLESILWDEKRGKSDLDQVFIQFEKVLIDQYKIMNLLSKFEDYDDPVKKFTAESLVENEIIPPIDTILEKLDGVIASNNQIKSVAENEQSDAIMMMGTLMIILAVIIVSLSIFLSAFMMRSIIRPINGIIKIVDLLGKGIVKNVLSHNSKDEIGAMINSVNALSVKLNSAALFAEDIGKRNFDSAFVPLSDDDNLGKALIAMRDKLRSSDQHLNEAQNKLIFQNKELLKTNSELDKFVYSVSHDLRAPLSSMAGVAEIVIDESKDEFVIENVSMIQGSIKKLDGFILDILDYSRNSRVEVSKEPIDLNSILNEIKKNLKYMGKDRREVRLEMKVNCPDILNTDKSRLSIILNNLISNAIRYSDPKSSDPYVLVEAVSDSKRTRIVVKDNGIGIDKASQTKVFDMFYRVSKDSIGSGLGLYIVKECVTKLMGTINIVSEVGKGTEFHVEIPHY
ncbi:MAG: GHKL domain-containing protein [Bacteroidia bacterium]|nr:GHKL domain-containing protein [Bacteroidota bacterium]MBP6426884.1 GHKL domain-containing protein [Bacteroidia bacterium]